MIFILCSSYDDVIFFFFFDISRKNYLHWKHEIYINDAEHMISYLSFIHYVVVFALEKWLFSKHTFFDHYCTLAAASLYSSNDFCTVTHKFVPGLLVLLHHKCICLSINPVPYLEHASSCLFSYITVSGAPRNFAGVGVQFFKKKKQTQLQLIYFNH